jgi:hypothetical protein
LDVSVDLRRHDALLDTTANLAGLVRLDTTEFAAMDGEALALRLRSELESRLEARQDLAFVAGARRVGSLPLPLLHWGGRAAAHRAFRDGLFSSSATLSNLGRLPLPFLAFSRFEPSAAFFVPPASPALPLFVTANGHPNGVELVATAPSAPSDVDAVLDRLTRAIAP